MNDIKLSHPFSPTQERNVWRDLQPEVFTGTVEDDEGNEFKVLITYHYFEHDGHNYLTDYNYRVVWPTGFMPVMRPAALAEDVRNAISAREGGDIIFTECEDRTFMGDWS